MSCLADSIARFAPSLQEKVEKVHHAPAFALLILAALDLGRAVAVMVAEEILNERGRAPARDKMRNLRRGDGKQGLEAAQDADADRLGHVAAACAAVWHVRGTRCPLDKALGLQPHQRSSDELKRAGCALAVFVPFEVGEGLLKMLTGVRVCDKSLWAWVQERGQIAMAQLQALAAGDVPEEEGLEVETRALPLLAGADGVMVPFRPEAGTPTGKTVWREVKVGILTRMRQRLTRAGKTVSQLTRRLVAVLGSVADLSPRLWLEARRQGILSSPTVVWLCDGGRGFWLYFEERFAEYAIGIFDFYHSAENLWKGARAWLDGRTQRARR